MYCDVDHASDITDMCSVTSTACLFNVNTVNWWYKKQTETALSSFNAETREMYKGLVDQKRINFFVRQLVI